MGLFGCLLPVKSVFGPAISHLIVAYSSLKVGWFIFDWSIARLDDNLAVRIIHPYEAWLFDS